MVAAKTQKGSRREHIPGGVSWGRKELLLALLLVGLVIFVYGQVVRFDIVDLDDPIYMAGNVHVTRGLSTGGSPNHQVSRLLLCSSHEHFVAAGRRRAWRGTQARDGCFYRYQTSTRRADDDVPRIRAQVSIGVSVALPHSTHEP